jgi:hypothetical protein
VRFLAQRFKNYLEHFFVSRYVVVGCVVNAVAGIEFFVIDEAKYFISYPLPFVVPADVGFYSLSQILDTVTTKLKKIVFESPVTMPTPATGFRSTASRWIHFAPKFKGCSRQQNLQNLPLPTQLNRKSYTVYKSVLYDVKANADAMLKRVKADDN